MVGVDVGVVVSGQVARRGLAGLLVCFFSFLLLALLFVVLGRVVQCKR